MQFTDLVESDRFGDLLEEIFDLLRGGGWKIGSFSLFWFVLGPFLACSWNSLLESMSVRMRAGKPFLVF